MKTDAEIQKDVMDELKWEPFLKASEIGVAVKNGVVTLSGTVDSYWKKVSAESAAGKVSGVKAVAEDIVVKFASDSKKTDAQIAEAVLNALKWNSSVPEDKLKVKVEDGWVTLDGEVEWDYQRKSANSAVNNLLGVVGISNNIRLATKVTPGDIKRKISAAFQRSATVDSEKITISVDGDKVTLTGKVRSYAESKDAETAAWMAAGINKVDNRLTIDSTVYA